MAPCAPRGPGARGPHAHVCRTPPAVLELRNPRGRAIPCPPMRGVVHPTSRRSFRRKHVSGLATRGAALSPVSHETPRSLEKNSCRSPFFSPTPAPSPVLFQSRPGALIQSRSPELVVSSGRQCSYEASQRRAASCGRTAARLAEGCLGASCCSARGRGGALFRPGVRRRSAEGSANLDRVTADGGAGGSERRRPFPVRRREV